MGFKNTILCGWKFLELSRRANGARRKIAAAIGAGAAQFTRHTIGAEGAFEGANHRLAGLGR